MRSLEPMEVLLLENQTKPIMENGIFPTPTPAMETSMLNLNASMEPMIPLSS